MTKFTDSILSLVGVIIFVYSASVQCKFNRNALDPNQNKPLRRLNSTNSWRPKDGHELKLGQVTGIGLDSKGALHVFHRGDRIWDEATFDDNGSYKRQSEGPIKAHTHLVLDSDSGRLLQESGANRFYMPHGLSLDKLDNVWLTDVAMHQVFKIRPDHEEPNLVLGEAFKPGSDRSHFCKPTDVAVSQNGDIFVADGYCNSRVVKFSPEGRYVNEFGKPTNGFYPPPPGTFQVPHSITLIEDLNLLCVADRENARIQCFSAGLIPSDVRGLPFGTFLRKAERLGRVFAIDNINHFLIGVTNDGLTSSRRQLFTVDLETGESDISEPGLNNPHDVVAAQDGTIFVAEIGPNRILKLHV